MLKKLLWFWTVPRLGPDILFSQVLLAFKTSHNWLLRRKLKYVGTNAQVRPGVYLIQTDNISLGKNVVVRPGTYIEAGGAEVIIENNVLLGPNIMIQTAVHKFDNAHIPVIQQGYAGHLPVRICAGAWVAANVTLLPGITIGENAVIGAGSIVTRSIPAHTLAYGVPCRCIKTLGQHSPDCQG